MFPEAPAASVSDLRVAPSGLFSCLAERPGRPGGGIHTRSRLGSAGPDSAYCPNPAAFRPLDPPALIVITFPARPFLPPSAALRHFIRWVCRRFVSAGEAAGRSTPRFHQVILGPAVRWAVTSRQQVSEWKREREKRGSSSESNTPAASGRDFFSPSRSRSLGMTRQGFTIPAARPPLTRRRCLAELNCWTCEC